MKNFFYIFLFISTLSANLAIADEVESCETQIRSIIQERCDGSEDIAMASLGAVALAAPFAMAVNPQLAIAPAGVGILAYWGYQLSIKHAKKILRLIEEAKVGKGPKIEKLWKRFKRKYPELEKQMTFEKFTSLIVEGNKSGAICKVEMIPERNDILKFIALDIKKKSELP